MFKWLEISLEKNTQRYKFLSDFLTNNGLINQVDFLETSLEDFPKALEESLRNYDGIRIGRGLGEVVLEHLPTHSMIVNKIKAADAIVKSEKTWWLRANAVEGFTRVLKTFGEKFDFNSSVLIVGSGAAARVATTSLFMCGFKNFSISSLDKEKVESMISGLSRTHLGVNFKGVLKEDLILLPGSHGVMVNTTPMTEDNPMLAELYYFNFFKSGGLAVDFSILPIETTLLKGAKDVGAECIYGYEIAAATDIIWCEQILGRELDSTNYAESLGNFLSGQNLSV